MPANSGREGTIRWKRGLGILAPFPRLLIVIAGTSLPFLLPRSWPVAAATAGTGVVLLALSPRIPFVLRRPVLRLLLFVPVLTAATLLLGNWLFSPPCQAPTRFWGPFALNRCGADIGLRVGIRFGGVNAIGLAWLLSNRTPEFYAALSPIPVVGSSALPFTRRLQFSLREYTAIAQSLAVRGLRITGMGRAICRQPLETLRLNLVAFLSLLRGLLSRFLKRTGIFAYAADSHQPAVAPASDVPAIRACNLHVRPHTGVADVISNADIEVQQGQVILVTGQDGAGKTTVLKAMAGVIPCVEGQILGRLSILGEPTNAFLIRDFGSRIAYFSQDAAAHILGLTVEQELSLGLELLAKEKREERVGNALRIMGLEALRFRQTTMLSGGETVRLLLAAVVARESPIVIFDDPFDQLDEEGRSAFIEALEPIANDPRRTVVVADRHADRLQHIADRVLVVENGGVVELACSDIQWADEQTRSRLGLASWQPVSQEPPHRIRGNSEPMAGLREVSVELGDRLVLRRISLEMWPGELVFIRGPNGSGKTTAMLAMVGALDANVVGGEPWRSPGLRFGYIFQDTALQFAAATCRREFELTRIARRLEGSSLSGPPIEEALSWAGAEGEVDPMDLHSSTQKLLAFAAMTDHADLVIVDEPTVGVGDQALAKLLRELVRLRDAGACVVIISHDPRLEVMADRTLVFENGRLVGSQELSPGGSDLEPCRQHDEPLGQ